MTTSAKPFSWVVRLTVAPLWVADGFAMTDASALEMLGRALPHADLDTELDAQVLEAPMTSEILNVQGYAKDSHSAAHAQAQMDEGTAQAGKSIRAALESARKLIDSVAYVTKEGDTEPVMQQIDAALQAINARQGQTMAVDGLGAM